MRAQLISRDSTRSLWVLTEVLSDVMGMWRTSTPYLLIAEETVSKPVLDAFLLGLTCLTNCPFALTVITEVIMQTFLVELVQVQNK